MTGIRIETDLLAAFRAARVLTLDELVVRLSVSRRTVVRRLSEHGYLGSYNASGRFLTVEEVARFDARGLWGFRSARFSRFGTLKETLVHFVASSASGDDPRGDQRAPRRPGAEHPPGSRERGRDLSRAARWRVRVPGGGDGAPSGPGRRAVPGGRGTGRASDDRSGHRRPPRAVRDPGAGRDEIVSRAGGAGVRLSRTVVDAIFRRYDLDKERAP